MSRLISVQLCGRIANATYTHSTGRALSLTTCILLELHPFRSAKANVSSLACSSRSDSRAHVSVMCTSPRDTQVGNTKGCGSHQQFSALKDAAGFAAMLNHLSHFLGSNHASATSASVNEYASCRDKFAELCWLYILPTLRTLSSFPFTTRTIHFQKFHTELILLPKGPLQWRDVADFGTS